MSSPTPAGASVAGLRHLLIASDHAGFSLKSWLLKAQPSLPWNDLGPATDDRVDYPDYANELARKLLADPGAAINGSANLGVLICGSGQGMCITANRHKGVRAALCWTPEVAKLARGHNDANVLCLPGRLIPEDVALDILTTFLQTPFEGGRHQGRVEKIDR